MDWWKQFKPKACHLRLEAGTKEGVMEELVAFLVKAKMLGPELAPAALKALSDREKLASTGVGMSVAIPHVKLPGLDRVVCSLSIHPSGVEWAAVDAAPVHILFTVLRPDVAGQEHDPLKHLEMMRWVARLARDGDFRSFALQARTKADLIGLLKEMSAV